MKFLKWLGIILLLLILTYFMGPKPEPPKLSKELPVVPAEPAALEDGRRRARGVHRIGRRSAATKRA